MKTHALAKLLLEMPDVEACLWEGGRYYPIDPDEIITIKEDPYRRKFDPEPPFVALL